MKHSKWSVAIICSSSLSAFACQSGDVNVGDGSPTETLGAALEDYEGTWVGYVEAHTFPDGSDRLEITLDENGVGQLVVGDSPTAPPPTDPEAAYPPGATELDLGLNPAFTYTVLNGAVSGRRIRLDVLEFEPYERYCAILDPIWDQSNMVYGCSANDGSAFTWRYANCRGVCVCTAEACTTYDFPPEVRFDAALTGGDELSGTIILRGESGRQRVNVRLARE